MITVQPEHQPVELTPHGAGYIYRGFRLVPNYTSPSTGRPINSPKGWSCPDFRQEGMSRYAWYPTLARFADDVDANYALAAEGKARSDRKAALLRAAENLNPVEAAQVHALVAECNRVQEERRAAEAIERETREAEQLAGERLRKAAPDLLAALREIVDHFQRTGDPTLGDMATRARAAITRATGS